MSHACRPLSTSRGPPNIILTSLFSGVRPAFPPNLGVFCLHERALLAIGLISTCNLVTTLGIVVRFNIAIKLESVHYALVACCSKYVHLLATTLSFVIRCTTAIRLGSDRCTLMTLGQVFVCCSATTLDITVRCNTADRYQTFAYLLRSLQIRVGLGPQTEVRWLNTCSHRFNPCPLPFSRFMLKEVYNHSIQVITHIPSVYSHRSVPRLLHPHRHPHS